MGLDKIGAPIIEVYVDGEPLYHGPPDQVVHWLIDDTLPNIILTFIQDIEKKYTEMPINWGVFQTLRDRHLTEDGLTDFERIYKGRLKHKAKLRRMRYGKAKRRERKVVEHIRNKKINRKKPGIPISYKKGPVRRGGGNFPPPSISL